MDCFATLAMTIGEEAAAFRPLPQAERRRKQPSAKIPRSVGQHPGAQLVSVCFRCSEGVGQLRIRSGQGLQRGGVRAGGAAGPGRRRTRPTTAAFEASAAPGPHQRAAPASRAEARGRGTGAGPGSRSAGSVSARSVSIRSSRVREIGSQPFAGLGIRCGGVDGADHALGDIVAALGRLALAVRPGGPGGLACRASCWLLAQPGPQHDGGAADAEGEGCMEMGSPRSRPCRCRRT